MNNQKQKLLVDFISSSSDVFTLVNPIIKTEFFDPEYRPAISFLKEYFQKYRSLPTAEQIHAESGVRPDVKDLSQSEHDYALDEIEKFCKRSAILNAVLGGPKLIEQNKYGDLEKNIKEAVMMSLNRELGLDYFKDPEERLQRMLENQASIPTMYDEVDRLLNGGLNRKEMTLFMANSGVGKSIIMSNLAVNYVVQKLNVVYVTLELSEDVVAKRFDSMFTGISQERIFKSIKKIASDLNNTRNLLGTLTIKRMPESTTCANDIKAYLKEFEMISGQKIDVLVVDYLDLMSPNSKSISVENMFIKDKLVAEEVRSIANEFNCITISACQMGRAALETNDHHQGHIQGGISKVNTADNLIAIIQNDAMKAAGEYMFRLIKTRSSAGAGKFVSLKWDAVSLRVLNNHDAAKKTILDNLGIKKQQQETNSKDILDVMTKITLD